MPAHELSPTAPVTLSLLTAGGTTVVASESAKSAFSRAQLTLIGRGRAARGRPAVAADLRQQGRPHHRGRAARRSGARGDGGATRRPRGSPECGGRSRRRAGRRAHHGARRPLLRLATAWVEAYRPAGQAPASRSSTGMTPGERVEIVGRQLAQAGAEPLVAAAPVGCQQPARPSSVMVTRTWRLSPGRLLRSTSPLFDSRADDPGHRGRRDLLQRGELAERQWAVAIQRRQRGEVGGGQADVVAFLSHPPGQAHHRNPQRRGKPGLGRRTHAPNVNGCRRLICGHSSV